MITNDAQLQQTIRDLAPAWTTNAAMRSVVDDYARYHVVFVVAGGAVAIGFLVLSVALWRGVSPSHSGTLLRGRRERVLSGIGAVFAAMLCALLTLVVVANATNARDPLPGFLQATTHPTPNTLAVDRTFTAWLRSGDAAVPDVVEKKIADRLAWQRPKAVVCGITFIAAAFVVARRWRTLLLRVRGRAGAARTATTLATTGASVGVALLSLVMFLGNLQGSVAPLAITMLGGS